MYNVLKEIRSKFAILSALFITVVTSSRRGHHHNCGPEELVRCAKPLSVITDSGLTFASSKPDLDKMCPDLQHAVRCIHGYSRHCMSQDEQSHFKKLFHGTYLMVHDLCKNETYQEEYLKHAPCMKRVENENEICLKKYTKTMGEIESRTTSREEDAANGAPDAVVLQKRKRAAADEGIKSVCCSFQEYMECSTHTMRRACGEEAADFSRGFLDKMSSSLIRIHCQEYGRRECGLMSGGDSLLNGSSCKSSLFLALLLVVVNYLR